MSKSFCKASHHHPLGNTPWESFRTRAGVLAFPITSAFQAVIALGPCSQCLGGRLDYLGSRQSHCCHSSRNCPKARSAMEPIASAHISFLLSCLREENQILFWTCNFFPDSHPTSSDARKPGSEDPRFFPQLPDSAREKNDPQVSSSDFEIRTCWKPQREW